MTKAAQNSPAPRARRTHAERNEEAERRLLDAAMRLVAEKGAARMTLSDIGDLSGYSRSLPAHHFGNKTGMLLALVEHLQKALFQQMRTTPRPADGLETLLAIVSKYLQPSAELALIQRAFYALRIEAMQEGSEIAERMAKYYSEREEFVERHLRLGMEKGEIHDGVNPHTQTLVILCSLHGIIAQWLANPTRVDLELVREETLNSLRRSLQPARSQPALRKQAKRN